MCISNQRMRNQDNTCIYFVTEHLIFKSIKTYYLMVDHWDKGKDIWSTVFSHLSTARILFQRIWKQTVLSDSFGGKTRTELKNWCRFKLHKYKVFELYEFPAVSKTFTSSLSNTKSTQYNK